MHALHDKHAQRQLKDGPTCPPPSPPPPHPPHGLATKVHLCGDTVQGVGVSRVGYDRGEGWVFFITEGEAWQAAGCSVVHAFDGDSLQDNVPMLFMLEHT